MNTCENCGKILNDDDIITIINDNCICKECLESNYTTCDKCSGYVPNDEIICTGNSDYVCENCLDSNYTRCDRCGEYFPNDDIVTDDNTYLCDNCFSDNYIRCYNCSDIIPIDESYIHDDEYYCEECFNELEPDISDYLNTPELHFNTLTSSIVNPPKNILINNRFFGIELEIDNDDYDNDLNNLCKELIECSPDLYLSEDGSLSNGIELKFHPSTLPYIKNKLNIVNILNIIKKYNFTSHDNRTCGLHLHVNIEAFNNNNESSYDIVTCVSLAIYILDKFWPNIIRLSRRKRDGGYYEKYDNLENITSLDDLIHNTNYSIRSHYQCLNISNSHDTVELRIFKGTLKYTSLIAAIEFYNNLITISTTHTFEQIMNFTWNDLYNKLIINTTYLKDYIDNIILPSNYITSTTSDNLIYNDV